MSLIRWSQSRDLPAFPSDVLNIQREINRMFESFFRAGWLDDTGLAPSAWSPPSEIVERENEYVVKVELPGLVKDDVKITIQDSRLTIRGEKKQEKDSKGSSYHRVERSYGSFERCFTLPSAVKSEKIDASFKDGVLSISLPKSEEAKVKGIEVKVK